LLQRERERERERGGEDGQGIPGTAMWKKVWNELVWRYTGNVRVRDISRVYQGFFGHTEHPIHVQSHQIQSIVILISASGLENKELSNVPRGNYDDNKCNVKIN